MRRALAWITLSSFVAAMSGCASNKHMTDYYAVEQARTEAIIESINRQAAERGQRNMQMMQSYSTSITAAATTPDASDDVAIALAWGYQMGSPDNIEIPRLTPIKAPPTNVDYIRAWSPIIGMALPFLYPLVWGGGDTSGDGSGNRYVADNGGSIILDSGNPGSYNTVGNNYDFQNAATDYALVNNSTNDNRVGEPGEGAEPAPIEGDIPIPDICLSDPGGLACEGCSCSSLAAGVCECPTTLPAL